MGRPDPVLNMFKDKNFIPLLVPQSGISPLQLVGIYGKNLIPLGDLAVSLPAPSGIELPPVLDDITLGGSFEGKYSAKVKLSVGLKLLGNILKALSGKQIDLTAAYSSARTITFKFSGVSAEKVEINRLDRYLANANIHSEGAHIEQMMIDDKVGVLTMILKSKEFVISAQREGGEKISVSVPVIQKTAGGSLTVESQDSSNTEISYKGPTPVTFAVQGIRLFFDDGGHYTAFDPFKAGQVAVRNEESRGFDTSRFEPQFLDIGGGFARFSTVLENRAAGK